MLLLGLFKPILNLLLSQYLHNTPITVTTLDTHFTTELLTDAEYCLFSTELF